MQNALAEYAKLVLGSIRNVYMHLDYSERIKISELTGGDRLIVDLLGINEVDLINDDLALDGILRKIENSTGILIYGAGNVGNKIWKLINLLGFEHKIKKIVVSSVDKEIVIGKHKVESIDTCDIRGVDLAIIATVKNQMDMFKRLREYINFDVIAISASMEFMVDNYLENYNYK